MSKQTDTTPVEIEIDTPQSRIEYTIECICQSLEINFNTASGMDVLQAIGLQDAEITTLRQRVSELEAAITDMVQNLEVPQYAAMAERLSVKTLEILCEGFLGWKKQTTTGAPPAATETPVLDPLYDEAKKIVLQAGFCSVALLQRKMRIGYTRAGRIVEQMEAATFVSSPSDQTGQRSILRETPVLSTYAADMVELVNGRITEEQFYARQGRRPV